MKKVFRYPPTNSRLETVFRIRIGKCEYGTRTRVNFSADSDPGFAITLKGLLLQMLKRKANYLKWVS